ncbi:hypothetical protein REC12_10795 [Desulfosporosinus sp. PR]|uniref:hypothetical protein n=1 Tax=Candidatus Desulfosporosinus nitrosoreducens TaxID=3401928 RepID=UPI0027F5C728|nr:hypothetical protein [Desulfosporosinus sp. PR]MDQ7094076.1 hypothetical protein [Desulfosporosinus sp. PR]
MTLNKNKSAKQVSNNQSTPHNHKNSPTSGITGKARDSITPAKDKSPDDLE